MLKTLIEMKGLFLFMLLFIAISCKEQKLKEERPTEFKEIEFKLEGFEWNKKPYKFTSYITDSVLHSKGHQVAAWNFSYIGDIENMHKTWDSRARARKKPSLEEIDSFALFERHNAIEYILKEADGHQVVIINEGHHMPQHRVFTTQLLDGLKKKGFKHLGLETYFNNPIADSLLEAYRYPILRSGYYTKEPQFGNLVRAANSKDFKIFGYESEGHENGKEREINQAKNIQEYIEKFPDDKVLIHCGFDHGYEGIMSNSWEKAMAGRLTEYTGIDPLTINQVIYSEKSKREYENPFYQLTDLSEPSVYVNQEDVAFGQYKGEAWFDIAVFHPRSKGYDRPSWMVYGDRTEVGLSLEEADIECPCLVFAYKSGEEIGSAVPYDIQETTDKKVKLVLDQSPFDLVIWNEEGKSLKTQINGSNR